MNKPALFLDFDGLKFDTLPMQMSYLNQKYGINSCLADFLNNYHLDDVVRRYRSEGPHPTREEVYIDLAVNLLGSKEWHESVMPIEGVCEVLPLLAQKYTLWTVTARQKTSMEIIWYLLEKHVPKCVSGIHCVWEYLGDNNFKGVPKKDFVSNFPGEKVAFIDDSVKEVLAMQDVISSYLFDPSGFNDGAVGITNRVRSWRQIGEIFLRERVPIVTGAA